MHHFALYRNTSLIIRYLTLFYFFALIFAAVVRTEMQAKDEYALKAEFICNFAKFVRWPTENNALTPLTVCILGENVFRSVSDSMTSKTVRGRPIRFASFSDAAQCVRQIKQKPERCPVLFISHSEKKRLARILKGLDSLPVLTIADTPGFAAQGGIINLIRIGNQLRFEINTETATRSGLKISSQLLKLARLVNESD